MNIRLKADEFVFQVEPGEPLNDWFDGKICLSSPIMGENFRLQTEVYCPFENWLKLCDWLEAHIQTLKSNANNLTFVQSYTWTPLDTGMTFTCLEGEVDDKDGEFEGGFGLRIMVKVFAPDFDAYVYSGLEGEVEIHEAIAFCQTLREYVNSQTAVLVGVSG